MEQRARDALKIGNKLFGNKRTVDSLWQELALNYYPERANFTNERSDGEEFSDHLFTSFPPLARRELGNLFASNLRPRSSEWFDIHVQDKRLDDDLEHRAYLEYVTTVQRRAMYDQSSQFVRATKEADHDFAAFGNAVIKCGPNISGDRLLYTCFHLRDCAWTENAEGKVDALHRNWNPTARQLKQQFPDKISKDVISACKDDPEKEIKCRHIVLPTRLYDYKSKAGKEFPFVSLYIDCEDESILEEVGLNYFCYVVPRWQTVSGSPFGRSMATGVALPDGRTMQVVVRVLREAGEKFVDPPMIMIGDAIRSDLALYPGGVTNADIEYDERLGEVLRPINQDRSGMPIGFEIANALREDITAAFFLDKIQLPEVSVEMTAYEVRRRIEQHIRSASPIFEPIEQEYNTPLCELTFDVLREGGAFGPVEEMPEGLQGSEVEFTFRSPISDMIEANEAAIWQEGMNEIIGPAVQLDPSQIAQVNMTKSVRAALMAKGWKAEWMGDEKAVTEEKERLEKQREMEMGMQSLNEVAGAAESGAKANKIMGESVPVEGG